MSDTSDHPTHVLIVEDHFDAAQVLERIVLDTFDQTIVFTAATVQTGKERLAEAEFDLALIDLGLPDGSGIELIRLLTDEYPKTLSIVTTIFDDESNLFEALKAGAGGYLLKGHSPDELKQFLTDAVSGRPALSPSIALSMLGYFRLQDQARQVEEETVGLSTLTDRETEILALISKGCQVKEVSRLLDIANNTVSHHIKSIYAKLNVHNRAEATAAAVKLKLYEPDSS